MVDSAIQCLNNLAPGTYVENLNKDFGAVLVPSVAQAINQIELFTTGIFCVAGFSSLFLNYCKAVLGSDIPRRSCAWRGICTLLVAVNKTAL